MNKIIFIFFTLLFTSSTFAATGYIDTSATNQAKVCYDTTCTSPTPSIINFELSQEPSIVIDSVTGLSGNVWGNSLGWIKFNPTGSGVSFSNNTTGLLTGKAWSQVSGWINFAVTGQSITISPSTGEFSGWAWTGGPYGGWIKFDCGDSSSCVRTTWRYSSGSSGGGGGGGSVPLPIDVCPNIGENQTSIPQGYTVNSQGICVEVVDLCPNLLGDQNVIPENYILNDIGACVREELDLCPNISGIQSFVASNYIVNNQGNCVKTPVDFCPNDLGVQPSYSDCSKVPLDVCLNLPGAQEVVPSGNELIDGFCMPKDFDYCPSIEGIQTSIPNGYIVSSSGECVIAPKDMCDNLGGSQVIVPKGFKQEGNNCFFITKLEEDFSSKTSQGIRIIALPFIPSVAKIPSDNIVLKSAVKLIDDALDTKLTEVPYQVDLVSTGLVGAGFIIFILLIIFGIKILRRLLIPSL